MIWCRPPPGGMYYRLPSILKGAPFYDQKLDERRGIMAKKPKTASRALALLLAAIMTVGSFQTTTYAAGFDSQASFTSASMIDDPVSGVTGSGWDNIGGGSGTVTNPSEEDPDSETPSEEEESPGSEENQKPEEGDPEIPDEEGNEDSESSSESDKFFLNSTFLYDTIK